jgi:endonuclease/exonuclease/phosphatase family metal-dependent hydrolase
MLRLLVPIVALFVTGCASTISSTPEPDRPLRIVSWNLEHLAEADGSGCRPRTEADYQALRAFAERIDADVIAFQEVESEAAAQRVFDPARYTIAIEERTGSQSRPPCRGLQGQHLNRQAVGFAIRRGLEVERRDDFIALQISDPDLRSGVDIEVGHVGGPRIRLLAVHLKSGCAAGDASDACPLLFRQAPLLEGWIDARAAAGARFAVLGDFNRRFAVPGDQLWADLDDGEPVDLALTSGGARATCDPRYTAFIDHIVIPAAHYQLGNFQEWTFDGERLSDHCPISTEMRFTRAD